MKAIPIGIVGAGRSRDGLGPFLAQHLERAGCVVTGVAGRSAERAAANAEELEQRLAHTVAAFPTLPALCTSGIAALVITSPAEHHLEALQAAAGFRLPTLCEKPLVHECHGAEGGAILAEFGRSRIPLMENCQWPYVLPAFEELHGAGSTVRASKVEMGLQPSRPGREMAQNTLSHLLSVIQRVSAVGPDTIAGDVGLDGPLPGESPYRLRFRLAGSNGEVETALHLGMATRPPRAAWLAIGDRRMDRLVGEGYQIAFLAGGRKVDVVDPTSQLVSRFARLVETRDRTQIAAELDGVRERHRLYGQILSELT